MAHPRLKIVTEPTPLGHAPRLSQALGIELHIKRDDMAGPSFGGNKSRQLEYYFGAALAEGADTILITGAVQSNFVRLAATIAKMQGLDIYVQLEDRVKGADATYQSSGNVLLSGILGAKVLHYPEGEDEAGADRALHAKAEALRATGKRPYIIPLAEGHPPLGALGYVDAADEILGQDAGFDFFVVASGSGSTHAGLLAGVRGSGSDAQVIGSCVRRDKAAQEARIGRIIERLAKLDEGAGKVMPQDIQIWEGALAPGYGQIGPAAMDAMTMMAQNEGVMLDPVYTAKSFAAVPALVADGTIPKGARVCFVHTGGLGALFAYADQLTARLKA